MSRLYLCPVLVLFIVLSGPALSAAPADLDAMLKAYWNNRWCDLQAWPALPRWGSDQLTFAGLAGTTFTGRSFTPPTGSDLPPVLYLLDRDQPQQFTPAPTHAWVVLDCRSLMKGYVSRSDPQRHPFAQATVLAWRALSLMQTRYAQTNPRIAVVGEGQGGGVALALGALCPLEIAFVAAHQPVTVPGSPQTSHFDACFDPLNFAARLTAPTLLSAGGRDRTVSAESIRQIHHQLAGEGELLEFDWAAHCQPRDLQAWDQAWREWAGELPG